MKQIKILLLTCLFCTLSLRVIYVQQGNISAGGEAAGKGGTMSYSVGKTDYLIHSSELGSLSFGLQQPWVYTVPSTYETPDNNINPMNFNLKNYLL